ncbi:MAG: hypothetical protein J6T23_00145 [Elusimicrobia bacterium]|nr:hypothetical protein [Elusimicrobiota bacterium]
MIIKFLRGRFNSIKICAVFTAACFMISTLGANLYAISMVENSNQKYEDVFNRTDCISNEYGKITSSKDNNSNITVINIQDLHCHPQTQRNISKIIAEIAEKYNLNKIYVEGGYGDIDISWLNSVKDENIRKQVIEKLLNEGILTGSEYYKLTSKNNNVELKGIDEEQIHKDNVRRLSWIIENQARYEDIIKKVENEIDILENIYVNNRNKRFSKSIEDYSTNKIDSKTFYKQMLKYVKDINANPSRYNNITAIKLEKYPNISNFVTLRKVSKDINLKEVTQQLQIVVNELKNKLPYAVYTKFLKETENLSNSQKVLELVTLLSDKEGINLEKYKSLNNFLKTNYITKKLNPIDLVQEESELILEIRKALSYNNDEYEITFISDFNKYFKDYLEYKLTDASWKYFEKNYDTFRQIYAKYAAVDRIKEIECDFEEINKYYDINDQRNNIFVKNLLKDEQINLISSNQIRQDEEILKDSKEVIIAVTGGFHSTELENILAKNDVNTIVITPKIYEDIKQANDKYIELIGLQSKVKSQALSYTIASCISDVDKQKLLLSIVKDLVGDNTETLEKVLGKKVDLSLLQEETDLDIKTKTEAKNVIETSVDQLSDVIPQEGLRGLLMPKTDEIMLNLAEQLVKQGIYFSEGMIFDIENNPDLKGKDLRGVPAEIYSRMLPSLQKALFKVSAQYGEVEQDIQDLYEDTGATESAYIYLEDINKDYQNFIDSLEDAIANKKLIVLQIFRDPVDIASLDREEQQKLYHVIRDMFFKIYTDKPLNKNNFVSLPENADYLDYDIHFFLLEILENSFMHGNTGLDKPIFVYMDKDEENEIKTLRIYNRNNPIDESGQMRIIRMKLALLGGRHKSNVLMNQNPYRTFEVDDNFKGKFYRVSSDKKTSYDEQAASWLRSNRKIIEYFSIFAPLSDRNMFFKTLSKIPHIWEELVFRTLPVCLSLVPGMSAISALIFFVFQIQFVRAHNISSWIEQNNLDWSTIDILKATLFNIFPEGQKEKFKEFAEETETINQTRQRYLPTILLVVPYLLYFVLMPKISVVIIASTIVGMFVHKFLNMILKNKMSIFGESINYEQINNLDFKDKNVLQDIKTLLSQHQYNAKLSSTVVEKVDFSDEDQFNLLYDLQLINDDILNQIVSKSDLKNIKHLNLILQSALKAGYLLSFQSLFSKLVSEMNFDDKDTLKILSDFLSSKTNMLSDTNIMLIIQNLDLNNNEHIKLLEILSKQNSSNTDTIFNYLVEQNIDLNDARYNIVFKILIDVIVSKYDSYRNAEKYFETNILKLPANTYQGKYALTKLIDLIHNRLIAHQNKYLKIVNGHVVLRVNENGTDPIFENIYNFTQDLALKQDLFDSELKANFDKLSRDVEFCEKMESKTPRMIYSRRKKVVDSSEDNVTLEEFGKEKGLTVIKQTPNVFFDSRRYSFTGVLNFLSGRGLKPIQHNPTYIMTKDTVDTENLDGIIKKFDEYMKLLDENLYILSKFAQVNNFSSQFDDVVQHIYTMIDCLEQINIHNVGYFRAALKDILDKVKTGQTTIEDQKKLIEYESEGKFADGITTINTLVNRIHQQANFSFLTETMGSIGNYTQAGHNILISKNNNLMSAYNLSSEKLNPQIIALLSDLAENPDFSTNTDTPIFIKDNIFLWVAKLGAHSVRILIDFNEESKSILVDFHEGAIDDGSTIRIKMLTDILESKGFRVTQSLQDFESRRLPVGIVARLDKDTGLSKDTDFNNLAKQAVILFNNAASLNNLIHSDFQIKQNVNVAKQAIMDIYSRYYALSFIRGNFVRTTFNSRKNLNRILKSLDLPLIPRKEKGFWTFLKVGSFRLGFIKTYGQNTIDEYINKPIEQAFATGYLRINEKGKLERNKEYNPIADMTAKVKKILESESGNKIEIEMLNQGAIISQLSEQDMNFRTVGQIGDYVVKTGYMKLNNGRLNENTKGEFLAITTLTDKNGIIRYTSGELVGYPETMNNKSGRINLNLQQLEQILITEGYEVVYPEELTSLEILNYRTKLSEEITGNISPIAYGTIISLPEKQKNTIFARMYKKRNAFGIYVDNYASPENVTEASKYDLSLFTGGSYSSHAGIVLREYKKTAMIVNNSQMTDGKMKIKFYQPKGKVIRDGNLETLEMEEREIELEPNDIVLIDTQNSKITLFEGKLFKKGRTGNILFELQKYIDKQDADKVKEFINRYKKSSMIDRIIEYIYYQSADNSWLEDLLDVTETYNKEPSVITPRIIVKKVLQITDFIKHTGINSVYRFGEKQSLDSSIVGTKSANQSKLFLLLEQLKKETGIKNVAVPDGVVIGFDILEKLLGEKYVELYEELKATVEDEFYTEEEKFINVQDIMSELRIVVENLSEEEIAEYIGKENLELFRSKKVIVRSSGVGEDSQEYSAAGIAESYGSIQYENINKAVKDTLLSFFSRRAAEYMSKSSSVIKPAVLIEEWIDADKAGIMMSEDNDGNRIIQVINGQGEDIVSGRITPYTFTIDIQNGAKIDGDYTNTKTLTKEKLEQLTKIMEWLEQVEGMPVDIEFLIKDDIIYIVQVRPITTLKRQTSIQQGKVLPRGSYADEKVLTDTNLSLKQKNKILSDISTISKIFKEYNYDEKEIEPLIKDFVSVEMRTLKADKENYNVNFVEFIKTKEDLIQMTSLMREILKLKIGRIETENDMLGLRIFFNNTFNIVIDKHLQDFFNEKTTTIQKYYMALSISRFISGIIDTNKMNYNSTVFDYIVRIATEIYISALEEQKDRTVFDRNTRVISLASVSSYDQSFEEAGLKKLLEILNMSDSDKVSLINSDIVPAIEAKKEFLRQISELKSEETVFISFDGHGFEDSLSVGFDSDISSSELAKALIQAYNNGMDLNKITINLSSCYSWYFANNVYDHLNKEFDKLERQGKVVNRQFPTIWASAGHETLYGYSTYYRENGQLTVMSNEWNGLISSIADKNPDKITINDIFSAMATVGYSNPTLFVYSDFIKRLIEEGTEQISEIADIEDISKGKETFKEKVNRLLYPNREWKNHISFFELSIFEPLKDFNPFFKFLNKTAPIWEEIFFKALPMSLTLLPFMSMFVSPVLLILFAILQVQFVKAHNVTLWIKQNMSQQDGFKWTTLDILKATLFNVFPSEELKRDFDFEQKINYDEETHSRILPTILLSVPYVYSILFSSNIFGFVLSFVVGMLLHTSFDFYSLFNRIFEEEREENAFWAKLASRENKDIPTIAQYLSERDNIDLKEDQEQEKLAEILDENILSAKEATDFVNKIDLNDINQSLYLINIFAEQMKLATDNRRTIINTLIQKADFNNPNQLSFIRNLLLDEHSFGINIETAFMLVEKLDFHNENHIKILTDFLKAKTYNRSFQDIRLNNKIIEKIDVNDFKQLSLLELFSDVMDNELSKLISQFDFKENDKKHLEKFLMELSRFSVLHKKQSLEALLPNLNLQDSLEFKMFANIVEKEDYLNPVAVGMIFDKLNLKNEQHIKLVKNIINKSNVGLGILDSLIKYVDINSDLLKTISHNIFANNTRDSHLVLYGKIREKIKELNTIDESDKEKYEKAKYITQLLSNELILDMQQLLTDIQNNNIRANKDKMIVLLLSPQEFESILENIDLLSEYESILFESKQIVDNFTALKEQVSYFKKMRAGEITIQDFATKYNFDLSKQSPNVYFDSDRYSFSKILRLIPSKILRHKINSLEPTYFMSRNEIEKQGLKDVLRKFDSYMKLLDENMYVLNKFTNVTAFDSQFEDVVTHINQMISCLSSFNSSDASYFKRVLNDILDDIREGRTNITEQKSFSTGRGKYVGDITTIHRLINRIHQQANMDFVKNIRSTASLSMSKVQNVFVTKDDRTIKAYNLSENEIHPNIKKLLILLAENPDFSTYDNSQIFIKDNIFLWNGLLGDHSARVLIDFNRENENIFIDFTEAEKTPQSRSRILTLRRILSNFGFLTNLYNGEYNLVSNVSKDFGLTGDTDICEMAQKAMILLSNAASLYRENIPIQVIETASMGIMDLYRKCFFVSTDNNIVQTRVNDVKFFNKILNYLQLPTVPQSEPSMLSKIKAGFLFKRKVRTLGQNTIDEYINKPVEQSFAIGYLKLNEKGELERNYKYDPISMMKENLESILDKEPGQIEETDMLNQGAIISQIPERDLQFRTIGQIGGYVVKTGYMKLTDGRLGSKNKGEFLAVTTLTDKNGIIRYSSSELVGFPSSINTKTGRIGLNFKQLKSILENEDYVINVVENFTSGELLTYRNRLKESIAKTTTPTAYGTIISSSKELKSAIGTVNAEADNGGLFIDKYASPENVTDAVQYDMSLFTGGSYSSHAGIVLREYGKTAMIVNDSRIVDGKMRIKIYQPKGETNKGGILESRELQESEIELQPNDIVLIDTQNNKMMLFESKLFKKGKVGNILFELQEYIDNQDAEKVKEFINRYKNSTVIDKIIEYIYYQSADNSWINDILYDYNEQGLNVVLSSNKIQRIIDQIELKFNWFLPHSGSSNVYRFGEKESLDISKVGTKSANQSKLYLAVEQLKRETGIDNVRIPNGIAIEYTILEDLLGEEYKTLYSQFESIVKNKNNTEQDLQKLDEIVSQIIDLINGISNSRIKEYIGKKNLKSLKNKLSIVRSSGVGEDGKSYSAAGIAESYGEVEVEYIPRAIRDVLSSFFSQRAIDYMMNSGNIIKPAVLIEEWVESDKAGIIMSENSEGNGIIQVVNGTGEDIVSGRKTPYSFVIDLESGEKIDGNYTGKETLTSDMVLKLTKIMQWLERVEGVPVDIEFLIKDDIIYIVQVRPVTTLDNNSELEVIQEEQITDDSQSETETTSGSISDEEYVSQIEVIEGDNVVKETDEDVDVDVDEEDDGYPKAKTSSKKIKSSKSKKKNKKEKKKASKSKKTTSGSSTNTHVNNKDIRQPKGYSLDDIIKSFTKLAQSKDSFDSSLEINQQQIKDVLLRSGLSKEQVEGIDFSKELPDYVVSLLKNKNSQITGTTIDPKKSLMENLKEHPILFAMAIETFMRVYDKALGPNATLGDLLSYIEQRYSKRLYEATCTDLRGYFGEIYLINTLVAGIIPDKRAGPIIIRPELPSDNTGRGFDIYDINRVKIQVKTGGSEIVHHHFSRYWFPSSRDMEDGMIAIPVITTKNIKNNSFPRDDRVQGMDVTTETVTKFSHEFISALHGIAFKRRDPSIKNLKLTDLIDNFKGFDTENPMSVDDLMELLDKNQRTAKSKKAKTKVKVIPVNQIIESSKVGINTKILGNQDIVVNINSEQTHVLYVVGDQILLNEEGKKEISKDEYSLYGIESVNYDENGDVFGIVFKDGVTISNLAFDGTPKGSQENNVNFSDQEIKDINADTGTEGFVDVYLDDDVDRICHLIKNAALNKKLIVFHFFKEGFKTSDLTPSQLLDIYKKISVLISNRFQVSDIFKSSVDYSQYTDYGIDFFLEEILKNALLRGSLGKVEQPVALYLKLDTNENIRDFSVYNKPKSEELELDKDKETLAISAHLMINGDSKSTEIMTLNPIREYDFNEEYNVGESKFRKADVTLREKVDMELYHLEQDYKKSEKNVSITDVALQSDSTVKELYRLGFEKYKKEYLKETGKTEKELTFEDMAIIDEKASNYRYTLKGLLKGVKIERYSFFSKKFLSGHSKLSVSMGLTVTALRMMALGIGLISMGVTSSALYDNISFISKFVFMSPLIITIITSTIGIVSTVVSGAVIHFLWNFFAVLTNNKDYLLQMDNVDSMMDTSEKVKLFYNPLSDILKPINLSKEIKDSEIPSDFVEQARLNGAQFISIYDLVKYLGKLKRKDFRNNEGIEKYRGPSGYIHFMHRQSFENEMKFVENSFGFALGLSYVPIFDGSKRKVNLVRGICERNDLVSWERGYEYFYGKEYSAKRTEEYMDEVRALTLEYNKKIVFFLPRNLLSHDYSFKTREELEYIQQHPELWEHVVFVFGTYDCLNIQSRDVFNKYFTDDGSIEDETRFLSTMKRLLSNPNHFMMKKNNLVTKLESKGLIKFFKNTFSLSFDGMVKTVEVLRELEYSKKQNSTENTDAVSKLRSDIEENNRRQVCFICTANINRSAVSHLLFEDRLSKLGVDNISVVSAGLLPMSEKSTDAMLTLGEDYKKILEYFDVDPDLIESFRSEEFSKKHADSNYFIVVSQKHKNVLMERYNINPDKIILYSDLDPEFKEDALPDPQKLKISKADMVKLVSSIFDNSLFNIVSVLRLDKIATAVMRIKSKIAQRVAVNYKDVKSTDIEQLVDILERAAEPSEQSNLIDIYIIEDIEQLKDKYELINTGIKVDGVSIYKIKVGRTLVYGAKGIPRLKTAKAIHETEQIKEEAKSILSITGEIETDGIIVRNGEGIGLNEGLLEIGAMELYGKTEQEEKDFMLSCLEINRAMGIMFGQKTIIGLESMGETELDKLKTALEKGRMRKVITESQFKKLNLSVEYISDLRQNGIEIYLDKIDRTNEDVQDYEAMGISGEIIRDENGIRIKDYGVGDEIEIKEILTNPDSIEREIITSDKPLMIGVDVLIEHFVKQRNIKTVQREFAALFLGKIKMNFKLGELTSEDMERIIYNIDYNKIPELNLSEPLQEYRKEDIQIKLNSLLMNIDENSEIGIILNTIRRSKNLKEGPLTEIIKERILAKTALSKQNKEFGLKDKNLEKLLGHMLMLQLDNSDKNGTNFMYKSRDDKEEREMSGTKEDIVGKIMAERKIVDSEKSARRDVAINTIIEIILIYGDDYKNKQVTLEKKDDLITGCRAMLAAA